MNMDFPEPVVQLVTDMSSLGPSLTFSTAEELRQRTCEVPNNPERQGDLYSKRQKLQQVSQTPSQNRTEPENGHQQKASQTSFQNSTQLKNQIRAVGSASSNAEDVSAEACVFVEKLTNQIRWLTERMMCRACMRVDLTTSAVTFLPCGHCITCKGCSGRFDNCPACGKLIMGTVRSIIS